MDAELIERRKRDARRIFSLGVLDEIENKDKIERSFYEFVRYYWPITVPRKLVDSWVVGAICEHLQACFDEEIRRLVVNVYQRSGKSNINSVLFPAWYWAKKPSESMLYLSNESRLAHRDADHTRRLIQSAEYQAMFGDRYSITKDAVGYYENDKLGSRISVGSRGMTTGFGGRLRSFDDPNDVNESPLERSAMNDRLSNLFTRSDDFSNDIFILVQQRTDPNDATGYLKQLGLDFTHLVIPLEYQGKVRSYDPRRTIGEIADPVLIPPSAVDELKIALGYRFSGQANQEPSTPEGAAVRRAWYPLIDVFDLADVERLTLSYDVGFSSSPKADWTWGSFKAKLKEDNSLGLNELTLYQHFGKWDSPDRDKACSQFGLRCKALIDTGIFPNLKSWKVTVEAGVGGATELVEEFLNVLLRSGLPASAPRSNVNKVVRSNGYISAAQAGKVGFYRGMQLPGFSNGTESWINPFFAIVSLLMYDNAPDGSPRFIGEHDDPLDGEVMAHEEVMMPEVVALTQPILFF